VAWKPGGDPKCTAGLTLADGKFVAVDGKFDAEGITGALAFDSLLPLRSAPSQKVTFKAAHAGGMPFGDGRLLFRVDSPEALFVEYAGIGWCGGRLSVGALRLLNGWPEGVVVLRADQVDLGRFLEQMKAFDNGHAEGVLSGRLPLFFGPDGIRLGALHLATESGTPGVLQLGPGTLMTMITGALPQQAGLRENVAKALADLDLQLFMVEHDAKAAEGGDPLRIRIAGRSRKDDTLQPVDITVNVRGAWWEALGLTVRPAAAKPRPPAQPR
jgi:hypothetical protein